MAQNDKDGQEIAEDNPSPEDASESADGTATDGGVAAADTPNVDDTSTSDSSNSSSQDNEQIAPLPDLSGLMAEAANSSIDLLKDVELNVKIELGRADMSVEEILKLNNGSVVELDKLAGDPVDILVNEQLIARGEVLVLNDNFCVRVNEIIPGISEQVAQS